MDLVLTLLNCGADIKIKSKSVSTLKSITSLSTPESNQNAHLSDACADCWPIADSFTRVAWVQKRTALWVAASRLEAPHCALALIEAGADVHAQDSKVISLSTRVRADGLAVVVVDDALVVVVVIHDDGLVVVDDVVLFVVS